MPNLREHSRALQDRFINGGTWHCHNVQPACKQSSQITFVKQVPNRYSWCDKLETTLMGESPHPTSLNPCPLPPLSAVTPSSLFPASNFFINVSQSTRLSTDRWVNSRQTSTATSELRTHTCFMAAAFLYKVQKVQFSYNPPKITS